MESPKDNPQNDIHSVLSEMMTKVINKWQDDCWRNIDGSNLTKEKAIRMIQLINHINHYLGVLLIHTEEIGGFGSLYPQKCLELMKTMHTILQMEIESEEKTYERVEE